MLYRPVRIHADVHNIDCNFKQLGVIMDLEAKTKATIYSAIVAVVCTLFLVGEMVIEITGAWLIAGIGVIAVAVFLGSSMGADYE